MSKVCVFKVGDRVRCISGMNEYVAKSGISVGSVYTVMECAASGYVKLKEGLSRSKHDSDKWWIEQSMFELVKEAVMGTFKEGDRVRLINNDASGWAEKDGLVVSCEYSVKNVCDSGLMIQVEPAKNSFFIAASSFELVHAEPVKPTPILHSGPPGSTMKRCDVEAALKLEMDNMRIRERHIVRLCNMPLRYAEFMIKCINATAQWKRDDGYMYVSDYNVGEDAPVEVAVPDAPVIDERIKELAGIIYSGDFGPLEDGISELVSSITGIDIEALAALKPERKKVVETPAGSKEHWYPYQFYDSSGDCHASAAKKYVCLVPTYDGGSASSYKLGSLSVGVKDGTSSCTLSHTYGTSKGGLVRENSTLYINYKRKIRPASIDEIIDMNQKIVVGYLKRYPDVSA